MCQKEKPLTMTGKSPLRQQEPTQGDQGVRLALFQNSLVAGWKKSNWDHTLHRHQTESPRNGIFRYPLESLWKCQPLWSGCRHWSWAEHLLFSRKGGGASFWGRAPETEAKLFSSLNHLSFNWPPQQHGTLVYTNAKITLAGHPGRPTLELMRHRNTSYCCPPCHTKGCPTVLGLARWLPSSDPQIQEGQHCPSSVGAAAMWGFRFLSCKLTYHPILCRQRSHDDDGRSTSPRQGVHKAEINFLRWSQFHSCSTHSHRDHISTQFWKSPWATTPIWVVCWQRNKLRQMWICSRTILFSFHATC